METSFEDCKRELLTKANEHGQAAYQYWRNRAEFRDVVGFVEGFTHRFIYTLKPADVRGVVNRTSHALGDVKAEQAITGVQDFTCPFALHHIFHELVETRQLVPTWEQFNAHIHGDAFAKWMGPFRQAVGGLEDVQRLIEEHGKNETWQRVKRAVRWRLGNFYMSAIRELDLLVRLRALGVPLRYHIFADVLLRVDSWTPETEVCVYFENKMYRKRKQETERFFPGVTVRHAKIERQCFGKIWLVSDQAVTALHQELS